MTVKGTLFRCEQIAESFIEQDDRLWEGKGAVEGQQIQSIRGRISTCMVMQAGAQFAQVRHVDRVQVVSQVCARHPTEYLAQTRLWHTLGTGLRNKRAGAVRQRTRHTQVCLPRQSRQPVHFRSDVVASVAAFRCGNAQNPFFARTSIHPENSVHVVGDEA